LNAKVVELQQRMSEYEISGMFRWDFLVFFLCFPTLLLARISRRLLYITCICCAGHLLSIVFPHQIEVLEHSTGSLKWEWGSSFSGYF
jgi:hypothetical protein